ncbi:MAG: sulfatase-like hydrolase/transferase [Bacteroidetes bacterium]|nr:sulfatase-like hydrolase/transferase [Bacteroidota bacterium]
MTRKIHICFAALLCCSACISPDTKESNSSGAASDLPNIVWLVAEDMSPVIPSFGDSTIVTPNLSRLASEGVRFTNVFSVSGVCSPSRAALATGMYPTRIGATHMRTTGNVKLMPEGVFPYEALPAAEVKLHSEYLRRIGYYCTNNSKEDYQFQKTLTAWDESSPKAHWRNKKPGQPFFAIFNFNVCHESQIWRKAEDSLWIDADLAVPVPPYLPDNEVGRRDVRRMYSNILEMDQQVGEILKQLEEDGHMDNTIIFWYADHGGPLPRQKRLLYDSGLEVPLIIRYPDKAGAGEEDDQLISFLDFKPTLLSMAGIEPPGYLDGRAFAGKYESAEKRKYIHGAADRFDERYDRIRAVRDHQYKYLRNYWPEKGYYLAVAYREQMPVMQELLRMRDHGELNKYQAQWFRESKPVEELFDTYNDPFELHNLAADPAYREKLEELRQECDRWIAETGDMGLIPETEYIESIRPGGVQPVTGNPVINSSGKGIEISCDTEGASIGYQLLSGDESPGESWHVYTEPIRIEEGITLVSIADRIGYKPSSQVVFK